MHKRERVIRFVEDRLLGWCGMENDFGIYVELSIGGDCPLQPYRMSTNPSSQDLDRLFHYFYTSLYLRLSNPYTVVSHNGTQSFTPGNYTRCSRRRWE